MTTNRVKHAVLGGDYIATLNLDMEVERKELKRIPTSVVGAWMIAQAHNVTHLWVMPGARLNERGYDAFKHTEDYNVFYPDGDFKPEKPTGVRCKRTDGAGREVVIMYPCNERFQWEAYDPDDILYAVDKLGTLLGVTPQWSPGHMGYALLKSYHTGVRAEWLRKPWIDARKLPFKESAKDVVHAVKLTLEMAGQYAHWYDKNSHYLGVARGVTVGCGDPIHVTHAPIDTALAGIYRVSVNSTTWPSCLPPIINTEWVTRDVLKYALANGYDVSVHEAYQFEESHQIFGKWSKTLWDARQQLRGDDTPLWQRNACKTVEDIAHIGAGRFASVGEWNERMYRPNWWFDLVGQSRAYILYHLKKFYDAGYEPIFVKTDEVCYLSSDPDIRTAIPGILAREKELGGFKPTYSLLLTEDIIRRSWQEPQPLRYLKRIATKYKEVQYA